MFKGILLEEKDGKVSGGIVELAEDKLPAGDVTVGVEYSTLNYKDGLILGASARRNGVATPRRRGSRAIGWWRCPRA
jgi:NADPH:quinone reductase-like Zn-dependent oxidoreductase